jgi:hypothetical protein
MVRYGSLEYLAVVIVRSLDSGENRLVISALIRAESAGQEQEIVMKWAGMYLAGFMVLIGGILAALWKLGVLQTVEPTWIVIGVVIALGIGMMFAVSRSGSKENIQIDRK